ncbi:MAG: aminotransferase class V-fold PLP-dependent enzyme [Bacillota bacterium]|nr:aminotransferase class V-fold PLP-dependent enzyme [Bacillota bacterium]
MEKLYAQIGIDKSLIDFEKRVELNIESQFKKINETMKYNQIKVLKAFQNAKVGEDDFNSKSGYGFSDIGREKLEQIYSEVFKTEDAIVRPIIVSGTHALNLCLTGLLFNGDEMISISGTPYDTLEEVIGIRGDYPGNLINMGVKYKQIELTKEGFFDEKEILNSISKNTKMVYIQRSSGYSWRNSLTINDIETIIKKIRLINNKVIVMLDNCYGEFLNKLEPTEVGVDIMAGSLIKNPGGGLAISGGYIVGKKNLIDLVSQRLTSPGIGKEQGLMFNQTRSIMQGFFIAPKIVSEALKGAIFCAESYTILGFDVNPSTKGDRSDIIQSIKLKDKKALILFCQAIQEAAPIDSYLNLEPWDMPGYGSKVIMAAGAFVQGSSIELSADAPIKEPYIVYFQGGLTYEHAKIGVLKSITKLKEEGIIE